MSSKLESRQDSCEEESPEVLELKKSAIVHNLSIEESIDEPYIRIFDYVSKSRMVVSWPLDLKELPKIVKISCERNNRTFSVTMEELIKSYQDNKHQRTSTDLSFLLILPEASRDWHCAQQIKKAACDLSETESADT